jgi:hypothetical protein
MNTVRVQDLQVTLEQLMQLHGVDGSGRAVRPGILEGYSELLSEGLDLARPRYGYDSFRVAAEMGEELVFETGHRFTGEVVARNLKSSEAVFLILCTIGPGLEARVTEYRGMNQPARAYTLDSVGSLITDELGRIACAAVDELAREAGLSSTVPLSPGYTNWAMTAQEVFYDLLDFDALGVSLSATHIMSPLKSCTLAIGVGTRVKRLHDGATCDFCQFNGRCNLQKARATTQTGGSENG